jgi:hypothetical protein
MNGIIDFLQDHPFLFGLLVGLACAAVVWVRGLVFALARRRELKRLKELLQTKLELEARAHRGLQDELERLSKHNENLRVTVQALQQNPDRAELRQLYVYDRAIRLLLTRSAGFGPAWQVALDEAEQQVVETETGLSAFVRRVFSPRPVRQLPEDTEVAEARGRNESDT